MIICLILAFVVYVGKCMVPFEKLQGFGTDMNIKIYKEVVAVDEISLKNYVQPYTWIKIKPNSTISMKSILLLKQVHDIIIQGPATLNRGIYIENCTNIILHNTRILNASVYGVLVYGSKNVVLNQLTIIDSSRDSIEQGKCIDITEDSSNITISNTILGYSNYSGVDKYKGMLIANFLYGPVTNVSIHHNIFYQNYQRSPQISTQGLFDFRNNIIFGYTQYGSRIRESAVGNFQSNYYIGGKKDPLVFNETSKLSYCEDNHWLFNFTEWRSIPSLSPHKYKVPFVITYNFSELIKKSKEWGCSPQDKFEKQIRQNIYKYCNMYEQEII